MARRVDLENSSTPSPIAVRISAKARCAVQIAQFIPQQPRFGRESGESLKGIQNGFLARRVDFKRHSAATKVGITPLRCGTALSSGAIKVARRVQNHPPRASCHRCRPKTCKAPERFALALAAWQELRDQPPPRSQIGRASCSQTGDTVAV